MISVPDSALRAAACALRVPTFAEGVLERTGDDLARHSVRNQASRIPPNPEIIAPTVQSCSYML